MRCHFRNKGQCVIASMLAQQPVAVRDEDCRKCFGECNGKPRPERPTRTVVELAKHVLTLPIVGENTPATAVGDSPMSEQTVRQRTPRKHMRYCSSRDKWDWSVTDSHGRTVASGSEWLREEAETEADEVLRTLTET